MLSLEAIVNKHGQELEGIKENIHNISVDLQLLIRDNKYITAKMEEFTKKIESFGTYLYCIENHTKIIERLLKDQESMSSRQQEFEQKFRIIDEREKVRSSIWRVLGEQWWKILAIISSLTMFSYELGATLRRILPGG